MNQKKETLYIISTNGELLSLSSSFFSNYTKTKKEYDLFIQAIDNEIAKKKGVFNNHIYLGLLSSKRVIIHQKVNVTNGRGLIIDEEGNLARGAKSKDLIELIDKHYIGDGTIMNDEQTPINTIVEFSPTELYPEVIKKLEQKYNIERIFIENQLSSTNNKPN
jgi:hypothetical protein